MRNPSEGYIGPYQVFVLWVWWGIGLDQPNLSHRNPTCCNASLSTLMGGSSLLLGDVIRKALCFHRVAGGSQGCSAYFHGSQTSQRRRTRSAGCHISYRPAVTLRRFLRISRPTTTHVYGVCMLSLLAIVSLNMLIH